MQNTENAYIEKCLLKAQLPSNACVVMLCCLSLYANACPPDRVSWCLVRKDAQRNLAKRRLHIVYSDRQFPRRRYEFDRGVITVLEPLVSSYMLRELSSDQAFRNDVEQSLFSKMRIARRDKPTIDRL